MKSFFPALAGLATTFSFLGSATAQNGSCPIPGNKPDEYWSVVGVQTGEIHPRLEIRMLERDHPDQWNLFLLALSHFQAMDQNDKLSYFQLAGIHGAPFKEWDRAQGSGNRGYCTHRTNVFATWHRPYLAAFEQVLHTWATSIASTWPEEEVQEQLKAANSLRLPFWDWALDPATPEGVMPESLRREKASVVYPNGTRSEIPNPLYQYTFHPMNPDDFPLGDYKYAHHPTTIRLPAEGEDASPQSQNDEVNKRITSQQPNNRDMVYKLLTVWQPFNEWSNKGGGGKIGNLETLHDGIHNSFGAGHMAIVEVAAFDPVFLLHHCNTDRIMALYQARYPDTWVEPAKHEEGSFAIAKDTVMNTTSPLSPFRMNAKGDFWTSSTSMNIESFGYTYPELLGRPDNKTLTANINVLYRPQTQALNKNNTLTTRDEKSKDADGIDWVAEVNLPADIKKTYSVRVFLGDFDKNPKKWPTDPAFVGQVASLGSATMSSGVIVTANVALADRLAGLFKEGKLKSLEKNVVKEYLMKNLHWKIQQADTVVIEKDQAPKGLNVTVASIPVHLPESFDEVPVYVGDWEYHPDITGE